MADKASPETQTSNGRGPDARSATEDATAGPTSVPEADTTAPQPNAEALVAAITERDEMKERLLRTLADMENLRRRTEREVADARTYAVTSFARDLLNSADNIRRAIESLPAETRARPEGALKGFLEGIELTERELAKTLERHGVKAVEPQGQRFDPNRHQAMFEIPDVDVPNGTVMQVVQTGYVIGERVLRPALVGVSKGGPRPEPKPEPKPADVA